MNVRQLIEKLSALPQERMVVCQVVGKDGSAWNMAFEFESVPHSDSLVVLTVSHHDLLALPKWPEKAL